MKTEQVSNYEKLKGAYAEIMKGKNMKDLVGANSAKKTVKDLVFIDFGRSFDQAYKLAVLKAKKHNKPISIYRSESIAFGITWEEYWIAIKGHWPKETKKRANIILVETIEPYPISM